MAESAQVQRGEALRLLKAGKLKQARRAYDALLAKSPEDAGLMGRLAQLELLEENFGQAETLLRRSLGLASDPRVRLRNLFELGILLQRSDRVDEMLSVVRAEAPDWPEGLAVDEGWRKMVLWTVDALGRGQAFAAARRLLDRAIPDRAGDPDALMLDGRLALVLGEQDRAARAASLLSQLGRSEAAGALVTQIMRKWAGYADPPSPSHRATILVCNPATKGLEDLPTDLRSLHFRDNLVSELAQELRGDFRFISVLADLVDDPFPPQLRTANIVLNNIVNAERLAADGLAATLSEQLAALDLPVINHPDLLVGMTREDNARLLADVPNLKMPQVERFRVEGVPLDSVVSDIADRFDFPLIVRLPFVQSSTSSLLSDNKTALLVATPEALRAHLERSGWTDFYAVEYVDLKRDDGFYRKVRAFMIGDRFFVTQVGMNREWMVSGWRNKAVGIAFYRANPKTIEESNRIVRDPEAHLGGAAMEALAGICRRLPADIFGVDFEVDREGQVVFFEATPAMVYRSRRSLQPPDLRLPEEPLLRFEDAFREMVKHRIEDRSASRAATTHS